MKFLVILICIIASYFWKQDLDRIDDRWFFNLRSGVVRFSSAIAGDRVAPWWLSFFLTFLIPLVILTLVLWVVDGWIYDGLTMLVHIFVLMLAFDRTQPGHLTKQYLALYEANDVAGGRLFLQQELACPRAPAADSFAGLHETFRRLYVYRCFEKMFVMFFWYLLAGPLGVLLAYICYQLRDGVFRIAPASADAVPEEEQQTVMSLIRFLEWVPVRLLGLTLSLAGNFEACFRRLMQIGWKSSFSAEQTIYELATSALPQAGVRGAENEPGRQPVFVAENGTDDESRELLHIDALQALMTRSQVIWLVIIALVTVLGVNL